MTRNFIYIDTSFFKALIDPEDDFHDEAEKHWDRLLKEEKQFITTNFVLDESYTLIRVRCEREVVRLFRQILMDNSRSIKIVRITVKDEENAWDWFWNDWSRLSYTDCVSFAVMKRLGIEKVATFDEHFGNAGYKIVK